MRLFFISLICLFSFGVCLAGPREDSLRYNSRCIRAHAIVHNYIPSTSQNSALNAASDDPQKVLTLLISYVKESLADYQNGIKLGITNPKLKGFDSATKRELVESFQKGASNCSALLKELQSIDLMNLGMPGAHGIKGKDGVCPHELDGRLNIAKFKKLK